MKHRFAGDEWHSFGPSEPRFKIAHNEQMVRSTPITLPNRNVEIVLRGKFDSVLTLSDSRNVVCDFKTSPVKPEHLDKYWIQLNAYAYALEHPAVGSLLVPNVDGLGLAVFEPSEFHMTAKTALPSMVQCAGSICLAMTIGSFPSWTKLLKSSNNLTRQAPQSSANTADSARPPNHVGGNTEKLLIRWVNWARAP